MQQNLHSTTMRLARPARAWSNPKPTLPRPFRECHAVVVLLAIALIAPFAGCNKHEASAASAPTRPTGPPTIVVTTAPVSTHPIQRSVEVVGTFYGCEEVVVGSKLTGRGKKFACDMGDTVRPGDVLMELDDVDFRLAVQEAAKALESELAKLGMHEVSELDGDLTTLPAVVRARLLIDNAAQ